MRGRVPPTVRTLEGLLELLRAASFDLLHFACHNSFQAHSPSASCVNLGAQQFQPTFLNEHRGRFAGASPMVVMNACRTDGKGHLYTRHVGWAQRFLDAGAGAFVGTHWEVRDETAQSFAEELYGSLGSGDTLGEAIMTARRAIKDRAGDPSWLAYTCYGDPTGRVVSAG
jgi:CHAT domain-containing protein